MDCIFCKIINGEIPCTEVYRDEHVIAFKDIHPKAPVHVLVVPLKHIESVNNLEDEHAELGGRILLTARKVAEKEGIADSGYRLIVNCGLHGGQEVPHLHLHVLGGKPIGPMVAR